MNRKDPIAYAKASCDTMMKKFKAEELPPTGQFHYHQGVFLSRVYNVYQLCGDIRYLEYIKGWVDSEIDTDGNILYFNPNALDDIQPGILLYPLLDHTGDQRYKKALDALMGAIDTYPRTPLGGLWHQKMYPDQMWLDGLYMGGPICAEYGMRYQKPEYLKLVADQVMMMLEKTRDKKTGLLYHAWDYRKAEPWADKTTGCSAEFWGRSIGWVPVAILTDLDFYPAGTIRIPGVERGCGRLAEGHMPLPVKIGNVVSGGQQDRRRRELAGDLLFLSVRGGAF